MKAIVFTHYGTPDGLVTTDVPKPEPGTNEILVRVRAATVTAGDTEIRRFKLPLWVRVPMRLYAGIFRPKRLPILGMEVAGEIEAVGSQVTRFSAGDEVFAPTGFGFGGYAEYVCLDADQAIARKPTDVPWHDAAPLSIGGLEALSFVRRARISPGEDVLIYGGSGSIGTYAVQLASQAGGQVTAVGNRSSLDLLQELGAQTTIDYTRDDVTRLPARYDVVIDAIGKCPFVRGMKMLRPGGRYLLANPGLGQMLAAPLISLAGRRRVIFGPSKERTKDLEYLASLVSSGGLRTVVDRTYRLEQTAEAHAYVDRGEKTGNVVIAVGDG